jgi:outer membrane protein OmpA-like peptidoglycan-associated protein/predicted  nucleic acid-binding Zn-ribbon protein
MKCDDSRAQRSAKTWLGPLLVAGVGIASTGALAAMPAVTAPSPHPGLVLIQAPNQAEGQEPAGTATEPARDETPPDSFVELHEALAAARERLEELSRAAEAVAAAGQLQRELATVREENQQLLLELETWRAERAQLAAAKQSAEARALELTTAAEDATAKAQAIDEELVAVRWQNAQLNTSLAQARAARDKLEAEARQTQDALAAKIQELQTSSEQAAPDAARLREQLEESEQRIAAATSSRSAAEGRLAELSDRARQAEQEALGASQRLAAVDQELTAVREKFAVAEEARAQASARTAALGAERDQLRTQLADVAARLERTQADNTQLETQIAELREAAGSATDVARQNLIAVENRIRELNEALGAIGPAGGPLETDPLLLAEPDMRGAGEGAETQGSGQPAASEDATATPAAPESDDPEQVATEVAASDADADLELIKAASAANQPGDEQVAALLADLSVEKRVHVQGLLADLGSKVADQGLVTTVPGVLLFALNSDDVQESAHNTLAKVAELITVYDDRQVRIVGHTDAIGDAAYNKQLSERRAELVKQFFVDNFEVDEARLTTQGAGEAHPIASNATLEGRRANRRVEVLILD